FYSRTPVSEAKVGCAKCGYGTLQLIV
ncbi:unnamed protein product, partial [Rotaria magnacalcarata]